MTTQFRLAVNKPKNTPPFFLNPLTDINAYVNATLTYNIPVPIDLERDKITMKWNFGSADEFTKVINNQ